MVVFVVYVPEWHVTVEALFAVVVSDIAVVFMQVSSHGLILPL